MPIQTIRNGSPEPLENHLKKAVEEVAVGRKPESDVTLLSNRMLPLIIDIQETIRT